MRLPIRSANRLAVLLGVVSIAGCQTLDGSADQAARISEASDTSRAALQEVVNSIFGTDVLLADDAFQNSSVLTIERTPPASIDNRDPAGRSMEMPFQLRLVTQGSNCIVIDERDDSRHPLANTTCEPID